MSKFGGSKYRNSRAKTLKNEEHYSDLQVNTSVNPESNGIKASREYVVVQWQTNVGGSLAAIPLDMTGRVGRSLNLVNAHSAKITDFDLSPVDGTLLATGGDEGLIKLLRLPGGELTEAMNDVLCSLEGHTKKLTNVLFNPTAANVLASSSYDQSVALWDVEAGEAVLKLEDIHGDKLYSMSWNHNGSLLATTCADKKLRLIDPRAGSVIAETECHAGAKQTRVQFLGSSGRVVTTGFSKFRDRQFCLWDSGSLEKVHTVNVDTSTGVLIPLYDEDTKLMVLAGKGDNSVHVFDTLDKKPWTVQVASEASRNVQVGVAMIPKLACDHMQAEVARVLKLTKQSVEPIMLQVPRKSYRQFHDDLFPPTFAGTPSVDAKQWFAGETGEPNLVDIVDPSAGGNGEAQAEVSVDTSSSSSSSSSSAGASSSSSSSSGEVVADAKYTDNSVHRVQDSEKAERRLSASALKAQNIVRKSYFRHVTGKLARSEESYDGLKIATSQAAESQGIKVNKEFFAIPWAGGGGQLGVFPLSKPGRLETGVSVIAAHSAPVTDFDFNPFNDHMLATASEDAHIKVWNLPTGGLGEQNLTNAAMDLQGHQKRVGLVKFHPLASDVLVSSSNDACVKVWDLESGDERLTVSLSDDWDSDAVVYSMDFSYDGKTLATACKDKAFRLLDLRSETVASEVAQLHDGSKGVKLAWAGKNEHKFVSVGFNRSSERQLRLWDVRKMDKALASVDIDVGAGGMLPFYDEDINVLYLGGTGEGIIRLYEVVDDEVHFLNAYTDSGNPQMGLAMLPKACNDVTQCEVATIYKLTTKELRPIRFTVPRTRKQFFQDDIFPDQRTGEPALSGAEWLEGQDALPTYASVQPEGMTKLSEAPVEARKSGKYDFAEEQAKREGAAKELTRDMVFDKFYSQIRTAANDDFVPGEELDGVDEDEWDDGSDDGW